MKRRFLALLVVFSVFSFVAPIKKVHAGEMVIKYEINYYTVSGNGSGQRLLIDTELEMGSLTVPSGYKYVLTNTYVESWTEIGKYMGFNNCLKERIKYVYTLVKI